MIIPVPSVPPGNCHVAADCRDPSRHRRIAGFGGKEKKPFTNIDGLAVWLRAAEHFVTRPEVKQCLIVVAAEDMELFKRRFAANVMFLNIQIVEGGKERFESVANALMKLIDEIEPWPSTTPSAPVFLPF